MDITELTKWVVNRGDDLYSLDKQVQFKQKLKKYFDEQNEILTKEYWVKYLELATKDGLTDFEVAQGILNSIEKAITVAPCCKSDSDQLMCKWKERCLLAENYINETPCDPDIYQEQQEAWREWITYKQAMENKNSVIHGVMPCGDCSTKTSACRTINCQYSKVHKA